MAVYFRPTFVVVVTECVAVAKESEMYRSCIVWLRRLYN